MSDERDMSRRRFAQALGGVGLAGGLGQIDGPRNGSDDGGGGSGRGAPGGGGPGGGPGDVRFRGDAVAIPSMYRHTNHEAVEDGAPPERETVYASMPREVWIRNEAAYAAERRINARLRAQHGTDLIRAGVRTDSSHVNHERVIDVRIVEQDRGGAVGPTDRLAPDVGPSAVREGIPGEVAGRVRARDDTGPTTRTVDETRGSFPVEVNRVTHELQGCDVYDHRYRPVPGGAAISEGDCGTSCTPAFSWNIGEQVIVTAGHLTETDRGAPVYQPESTWWGGNHIGDSLDGEYEDADTGSDYDGKEDNTTFDAATIDEAVGVTYELASDAGDDAYWSGVDGIVGTVPWSEIKQNEWNASYELTLQGSTTGRSSGEIEWASDTYTVYEIDVNSDDGDSGGPHFKIEDGYAYIAGVHNYVSWDGDGGATAMEEVEHRFDVEV